MLEQFHFLQPLWLLTLLPLAVILWLLRQHTNSRNPWQKIIDAHLLPLLVSEEKKTRTRLPLWLLSIAWLLGVLALANPAWEKQPQLVLQTSTSRVIVLDLSRSMLARDLTPSRLARARFKIEDILAYDSEGQTGLVVFAGDAFTVTPLTRDNDTIRAQLKALEPGIMPTQGSRADLGLLKAQELLRQAGAQSGQIILIADGVEGDAALNTAEQLHESGYRVSVLGVGSINGAPLPDGRGGFSKTQSGKNQIVKLEQKALQAVAQAGGGRYDQLSGDNSDIISLLDSLPKTAQSQASEDLQSQKWKQQGPLLVVLLLPLAALAFRRGWLLSILLCTGLFIHPQQAMALTWEDLWQRNDQQAAKALQAQSYDQAARLAQDPAQRGSAEYKRGNYQQALSAFQNAPGSDADYNRGNALARLEKYKEALAAYEEALKKTPNMEDALANKAAIEALLQKQQKQQASSNNEDDSQKSSPSSQDIQGKSSEKEQAPEDNSSQASEKDSKDQSGDNQKPQEKQNAESGDSQQDSQNPQTADAGQEEEKDSSGRTDGQDSEQSQAKRDKQEADREQVSPGDEPLSTEEQLAAQQWLRRILDDPGGLLRRKFLYQYQQREKALDSGNSQNW